MSIDEFWASTPREVNIFVEQFMWRQEQFHQMMAWTAWHTAGLGRTKKMPSLDTLISKKPKEQSIEDQIAIMKGIRQPKKDL